MSSQAQVAANQANAQRSTGPTSDAGKAKSSLNAVKSGLTGVTVLLPSDDVAAYEAHIARITAKYSPVGADEQALVQSIADADWRLRRIPILEHGIYALGHAEFAPLFADQPEPLRAGQIQTKTYMTYEKQLRNLQLQQSRIRRHRQEDVNELTDLQALRRAEREARRREQVTAATASLIKAYKTGTVDKWNPAGIGFEFSLGEIAVRLNEMNPEVFDEYYPVLREKMAA
jgi:hypothetical protein